MLSTQTNDQHSWIKIHRVIKVNFFSTISDIWFKLLFHILSLCADNINRECVHSCQCPKKAGTHAGAHSYTYPFKITQFVIKRHKNHKKVKLSHLPQDCWYCTTQLNVSLYLKVLIIKAQSFFSPFHLYHGWIKEPPNRPEANLPTVLFCDFVHIKMIW